MGLRSSRCDVCNAFADLKCTGYGRDAHTRASADELQAETRCSHGAAPGVLGMTQRMRVCTEMGQCAEIGWVRICRRWSQARSTGGRRRLVVGARWVGRKAVRAPRSAACDYPTDHALHGACAHTASIIRRGRRKPARSTLEQPQATTRSCARAARRAREVTARHARPTRLRRLGESAPARVSLCLLQA